MLGYEQEAEVANVQNTRVVAKLRFSRAEYSVVFFLKRDVNDVCKGNRPRYGNGFCQDLTVQPHGLL